MLIEGKTDKEVLDFMYFRYGDFVLYDPRFDLKTLALWLSPVLLFLAAGFIWLNTVRAEKDVLPWDEDDEKKAPNGLASPPNGLPPANGLLPPGAPAEDNPASPYVS